MEIDAEIRAIKEFLSILNEKIDLLLGDRETLSMMRVAERSLKGFLEEEPDLYSFDDVKVRYH